MGIISMSECVTSRITDNGQVTFPEECRRRRGIKEGDLVEITETDTGWLVTPRAAVLPDDQPTRSGLSLDPLIAPSKAQIDSLLRQH